MRMKNKIDASKVLLLSLSLSAAAACQTTRLPTALKNSDHSAMTVQVSDDQRSLMWNNSSAKADSGFSKNSASQRAAADAATLQAHAEMALLGRMTRTAVDNAKSILGTDIRNVRAMKTLIKAALMERKSHEAITLSQTAQSLSPQDPDLFALEGMAQHQLGHVIYAKALWNKTLSLDPLHIPTLMNLGVMLFQNGHINRAGAQFDKVISIVPQHLDAQVGKALVMSAQGQATEAVVELEGILKKTGDNSLVLENLALICRDRLKDYKKAARYVDRALALGKSDRRSTEMAINMKQDLRRLLASQEKQYSDESLREMAAQSAQQSAAAGEAPAANANSQDASSELFRMEESIK